MKQFFAHYSKWEDYKSGMFNVYFNGDYNKQIELSANLLKQPSLFYDVCKQLINDWIIASKVNLSNCQQNRRAWLGAAACCYNLGSPEFITRLAWFDSRAFSFFSTSAGLSQLLLVARFAR